MQSIKIFSILISTLLLSACNPFANTIKTGSSTTPSFTVSGLGDANLFITLATYRDILAGQTQTFTVIAKPPYSVAPTVSGTCALGSWTGATSYQTGQVTANCTVQFSSLSGGSTSSGSFTVTSSGDANEWISPTIIAQQVVSGQSAVFTVTPHPNFIVN